MQINPNRFWKKVNVQGGDKCWLWTACTDDKGYGKIAPDGGGVPIAAHRAAWVLTGGALKPRQRLLRRCKNRLCVNPHHMQATTVCRPYAKLQQADVDEIRRLHKDGDGVRALARRWGISPTAVSNIIRRKTWK